MSIKVSANEMRELADLLNFAIHDDKGRKKNEIGFALLTFDVGTENGMFNYICNCQRSDMIRALKEFIHKNETHPPFPTPEEN